MLPPTPGAVTTYTVKNTFIVVDDGDEDAFPARRTSSRRAFSTCPDVVQATEDIPKLPFGCSWADAQSEDDAQPEDEPEAEVDPTMGTFRGCRHGAEKGHQDGVHRANSHEPTIPGCSSSNASHPADEVTTTLTTTTLLTTTTTIVSRSVPRILIDPCLTTTSFATTPHTFHSVPAPVTTSRPVMTTVPLPIPTQQRAAPNCYCGGKGQGANSNFDLAAGVPITPRTNSSDAPSKGKGKQAPRTDIGGKAQGKAGGKGRHSSSSNSAASSGNASKRNETLSCHLFINQEMAVDGFDLNQKIIGKGGCNTKGIFAATGTKIRLRGRGSGHLENATKCEANVPLMLAVTGEAHRRIDFATAVKQSFELLQTIGRVYQGWLVAPRQRHREPLVKRPTAELPVGFHPCWIGEMSDAGWDACGDILSELGVPSSGCSPRRARPTPQPIDNTSPDQTSTTNFRGTPGEKQSNSNNNSSSSSNINNKSSTAARRGSQLDDSRWEALRSR
mmetsp:Transcript_75863/g.158158  ORF Transcript_75863/g.158158 Transcript_75863/m.158158 type:complete len:502 (+) Transcript_75863:186-1691(+)